MAQQKALSAAELLRKRLEGGMKTVYTPEEVKTEKTEKSEKNGAVKVRGPNGGAREGSGRKPLEYDEQRRNLKRSWEDYAQEEIEVEIKSLHKGVAVVRKEKMKRMRVVQEQLFAQVRKGDVPAIKEWNDRALGKSPQTVRGDDDEPPVRMEIGLDRVLDKVYGNDEDAD